MFIIYVNVLVFQCSLNDCGISPEHGSGEDFRDKYTTLWNSTQTFKCYCNQKDEGKCVDRMKYTKAGAINSLVWPFIFLLLGIIMVAIVRCGLPTCNCNRGSTVFKNITSSIEYD